MDIERPVEAAAPASEYAFRLPSILRPGLPGRVLAASTMAGGIFFGGILVAASTWFDQLVAASVIVISPVMFAGGTVLGAIHGGVLGYVGRPASMPSGAATGSLFSGAIWVIPGVLLSLATALGIAASRWSMISTQPLVVAGAFLTWLVGVGISVWCTIEVSQVLSNALSRWPERRPGVPLALIIFVVLVSAFVIVRPEIWFTDLRVSPAGAVVLALGLTLWVAVPVEVVLLHFVHRPRHA
jgi:hypothetical protein